MGTYDMISQIARHHGDKCFYLDENLLIVLDQFVDAALG